MIRVHHIRNILDPVPDPATLVPWRAGLLVRDLAPSGFDLEGGHVVIRNDHALTGEEVEQLEVLDGDRLVFGERPGVFGSILGSALLAQIANALIVIGVGIGISYGIAALTGPKSRMNSDYGSQEEGPARNFEGIQDTAGPGRVIPFVYGKVRTGGHFLQSFERAITGQQVTDGLTTLHTLMGICHGPIQAISGIQINGNAIETLEGVTYETRLGTPDQAPFDGFGEIAHEVVHERPILHSDDWQTFITTHPVQALEITFRFPSGLFRVSPKGQVVQADVAFEIQYRPYGQGEYVPTFYATKTVSASGRNPVKGQVRFDGLSLGLYEIKIRRTTADDEDQESELEFATTSEVYAISEITYESQAHPGLAMIALKQVPSAQLNSSVPTTYTFLVEGFKDLRIYSTETAYTVGWSDNPAWCCAHLITSPIHGLGDKYGWENIDIPSFLEWANYCDAQVDRGDGVLEKRATFNHIFDTKMAADEVLSVFTQGCGAMLIKRGNKWRVVLDREDSMVWIGTEGNIFPGTLKLTFLPAQELANRIQVIFANEENDYQRDTYHDERPDLLPGDKYVEADREIWGVTRPSQVAREVRRLLLHNKCATTQVELEAGLDSFMVTAGSIFGVAMPTVAVGIASGRLLGVDSSGTMLTIDEEVTLTEGQIYEIVVHHAQGDAISTKRIVSPAGTRSTVAVSDPTWAGTIAPGDVYSLGLLNYSIEKFRCIETSLSDDFRRKIKGYRYDLAVYTDDLEAVPNVIQASLPDPRLIPPDAQDLTLRERQEIAQDGTILDLLDVDWTAPISSTLDHYEVWLRAGDSAAWVLQGETKVGHLTLRGLLAPGYLYEVSIVSVSSNGQKKAPAAASRATVVTEGRLVQPPTPTNALARIIDGTLVVTVDPLTDEDLGPTGYYEWRIGTAWNQSQLLATSRIPRIEIRSYSHGTATIMVAAVNSTGNRSPSAASTSIELIGSVDENIILTQEEGPGWAGARTGFTIEGGTNKLTLFQPVAATVRFTRRPRRTRRSSRGGGWGAPDPAAIAVPEGWYTSEIVTLSSGALVRARPDIRVDWEAIYIGLGTFNTATFSFDDPKAQIPFSGREADKIVIAVQSRYSTTDSLEASFSEWGEHRDRGEISMRYFQFRIRAVTENPAYSLKISQITLTVDLPDKAYSGRASVLSANPVSVTYPTGYFVDVKRLVAIVVGGAVGDTLRITAEDEDGFTAEIRDSAGDLTTGSIHYEAKGY